MGLPKGRYWGVYLGDERNGAWKIDIWVSEPEAFAVTRAYSERIAERLSESSRLVILAIKSACWRHPEYRRRFSSIDIYSAVLEHGVADLDGFWAFLKERHRPV